LVQKSYHGKWLLRARRKRPCRLRAEKRDELSPFHVLPLNARIAPYHIVIGNTALCITAILAH
jgi:hypothetical protein